MCFLFYCLYKIDYIWTVDLCVELRVFLLAREKKLGSSLLGLEMHVGLSFGV